MGTKCGVPGSLLAVLLLLMPLQAEAAGQLILLDLPTVGPLAGTAASVYSALVAEGFDVWWLRVHEPQERARDAAAICCTTTAPLQRDLKLRLDEYVKSGGGLVYIASTNEKQLDNNRNFFRPFGMQITSLEQAGHEVRLNSHPIMAGLEQTRFAPVAVEFTAAGAEVLATQDGRTVAFATRVGEGRLVVLPAPMVVAAERNHAPNADKVQLLTQALKWAADSGSGGTTVGPVSGPGAASTDPVGAADLAPRIVVDMPETALWTPVIAALQDALGTTGLPTEKLAYQQGAVTLANAAAGRPALIALSSSREFEEAEGALLGEYVRSGGSLLVLGYGAAREIPKVTALNRLLGEFGIGFTFGRPAGRASLGAHPATEGLGALGTAPAGSAVWAVAQWPLASVGDWTLAAAHEVGRGRIVVFDAATLLPPTDKKVADESATFRSLLAGCVRWLTGR